MKNVPLHWVEKSNPAGTWTYQSNYTISFYSFKISGLLGKRKLNLRTKTSLFKSVKNILVLNVAFSKSVLVLIKNECNDFTNHGAHDMIQFNTFHWTYETNIGWTYPKVSQFLFQAQRLINNRKSLPTVKNLNRSRPTPIFL